MVVRTTFLFRLVSTFFQLLSIFDEFLGKTEIIFGSCQMRVLRPWSSFFGNLKTVYFKFSWDLGGPIMFDTKSDYALNKLDKDAIVCPSVTGLHTRLTREDFASEEEFLLWKEFSDTDYHERELAGWNDTQSLSLDTQRDKPSASAEDAALAPYIAAEQAEEQRQISDQVRSRLTEKQYRRLCLYYLEDKTEEEIGALEGVGQRRISTSITRGVKNVEKFFGKIFRR